MRKIGKKTREWMEARPRLIKEYQEHNITTCEGRGINPLCYYNWALSIHHLDKRSSGKAQHTFEDTRLLCAACHDLADHPRSEEEREFNKILRRLR